MRLALKITLAGAAAAAVLGATGPAFAGGTSQSSCEGTVTSAQAQSGLYQNGVIGQSASSNPDAFQHFQTSLAHIQPCS